MRLTLVERLQQKRLERNDATIFTVQVENEFTQKKMEINLYAESEEDAILLARRVSKRSERNLVKDLNFDISEIKDNKLGLIIPWKDPVNIRSVNDAVKMPLMRSKSLFNHTVSAIKNKNTINLDALDENETDSIKTACFKSNFVSLILLLISVYIFFIGSGSHVNYWSIALCLTASITSYIKTKTTLSILKQVEITRHHIETEHNE